MRQAQALSILGSLALITVLLVSVGTTAGAASDWTASSLPAQPGQQIEDSNASLTILNGEVFLRKTGSEEWTAIAENTWVAAGDTVKTGENGAAVLTFLDGTEAVLDPNTEMSVEVLRLVSDEPIDIQLRLWIGSTWHKISKFCLPESRYEIDTPSAALVARGTSWWVHVDESQDTSAVILAGQVDIEGEYTAGIPEGLTPEDLVPEHLMPEELVPERQMLEDDMAEKEELARIIDAIAIYYADDEHTYEGVLPEVRELYGSGVGLGVIVKLYALGKTTDEILERQESGLGWGEWIGLGHLTAEEKAARKKVTVGSIVSQVSIKKGNGGDDDDPNGDHDQELTANGNAMGNEGADGDSAGKSAGKSAGTSNGGDNGNGNGGGNGGGNGKKDGKK